MQANASTHQEGVTHATQLCFYNKTGCNVRILWLDYQGRPRKFDTLYPGGSCAQSTFSTHPWRADYSDGHSATYMGGSALLVLLPGGELQVQPFQENPDEQDSSWWDPAWGDYKQRSCVLGMPIMAYDCVSQEVPQLVCQLVTHMLAGCPPAVLQRVVAAGCKIAIIGRRQVTTDIPAHHFMKARSTCEGARDTDATTRGLGASRAVPTTSCGEENITMVDDSRYACENILMHELGHAVMNLGFDKQQMQRVHACYGHAKRHRLYDRGCYMLENAAEYWAEGCQSWFDATVRTDVNSGINTREKLKAHDPCFAELLAEVFGDSAWRYPHTAPAPFHKPSSRRQSAPQQPPQQLQPCQHSTGGQSRVQTRSMTTAAAAAAAAAGAAAVAVDAQADPPARPAQAARSRRRKAVPKQQPHRTAVTSSVARGSSARSSRQQKARHSS